MDMLQEESKFDIIMSFFFLYKSEVNSGEFSVFKPIGSKEMVLEIVECFDNLEFEWDCFPESPSIMNKKEMKTKKENDLVFAIQKLPI